MSAVAGWYQGVRRLFAAWCSPCRSSVTVPRRSCRTLADGRNEPKELPVRSRRIGWLAWSLWGLTMVLLVAAIWLWLGARSRGGGYFAPQVFIVPGFATVGAVIAARRANRVGWLFVGLGFVAALQAFSMAYGAKDRLMGPGALPAISVIGPLEGLVMAAELPALLPNHAAIPRWAAALAALATRSPLHPRRPGPCRSC
jgi:hypothetical protein